MKRLLIVSANFPPTNAVDIHRIRVSLPFYEQFGWQPHVLCFDPTSVDHPTDERLLDSISQETPIHRVRCLSRRWTQPFGFGAVGFRGWPAMRRAGLRLIRKEKPDLILFSTTSFPLMTLGPAFSAVNGAPYVLDFQDPWVSPEGSIHRATFKHRLAQLIHTSLEPHAVCDAAGFISVSPEYLEVLHQRYPRVSETPQLVIPFAATVKDIDISQRSISVAPNNWPAELLSDLAERKVGLYAGAYVDSMKPMVRALFRAIRDAVSAGATTPDQLRLWFIGSNYAAHDKRTPALQLAAEYGLQHVVREVPQRFGYYDTVQMLRRSAFNLLFGSQSSGYNPSKLFNVLQCERPILAFVQPHTAVSQLLYQTGGALVVEVDGETGVTRTGVEVEQFLKSPLDATSVVPIDRAFVEQHSAEASTKRQAVFFGQVLDRYQTQRRLSHGLRSLL